MFKLKYRNNGSTEEASFDSYRDLVYFVAKNKIADEAVESITLFGEEMTLNGLADKVVGMIDEERMAEAMEELTDDETEEAQAEAAPAEDFIATPEGAAEAEVDEPEEEKPMSRADEILAWFDNIYKN